MNRLILRNPRNHKAVAEYIEGTAMLAPWATLQDRPA